MDNTPPSAPIVSSPSRKPKRRKHRSRDQWVSLIAQQGESGLNIAEFCAQQSVSVGSFYAWKKRLARDGPVEQAPAIEQTPGFVRLEAAVHEEHPLTAYLPGGIRIELNTSALPAFIAACRQADAC